MNWVIPLQASCAGIAAVLTLPVCLPELGALLNPVQQSRLRGKTLMLLLTALPIHTHRFGPIVSTYRTTADCQDMTVYRPRGISWPATELLAVHSPKHRQALHRHRLAPLSKMVTKVSQGFCSQSWVITPWGWAFPMTDGLVLLCRGVRSRQPICTSDARCFWPLFAVRVSPEFT